MALKRVEPKEFHLALAEISLKPFFFQLKTEVYKLYLVVITWVQWTKNIERMILCWAFVLFCWRLTELHCVSLLLFSACHGAPKNCKMTKVLSIGFMNCYYPLGTNCLALFVQAFHISSIKPSCKAEECKCAKHYFLRNNLNGYLWKTLFEELNWFWSSLGFSKVG